MMGWGPRKLVSAFAICVAAAQGGEGVGLASQAGQGVGRVAAVQAQSNPLSKPNSPTQAISSETGPVTKKDRGADERGGGMLPLDAIKKMVGETKVGPTDPNSPLAPIGSGADPGGQPGVAPSPVEGSPAPPEPPGYAYHPDNRRDPFMAIVVGDNKATEVNLSVPPLQRVALSELSLIGLIWGGFGYVAMVQTPDGRGYTVREGTRLGSGNGVVSSITQETLTIKEPFSDIYGRKEMREHLMVLHPKVNAE